MHNDFGYELYVNCLILLRRR